MKSDEIYNAWKDQRTQIEAEHNFAKKTMNRIHQYEQNKRKPLFYTQRLIELISAHPLAKAAIFVTAFAGGIIRTTFMLYVFLAT